MAADPTTTGSVKVVDKFSYQFASSTLSAAEITEFATTSVRDARPAFGYTALTLGRKTAPVFTAIVEAASGSGITGQIAAKMSVDAMREKALEVSAKDQLEEEKDVYLGPPIAEITRAAYKEANQEVYEYGHRMAAGGQIAAKGLVATFDGKQLSIGRVGDFFGFLWRKGEVLPLYEDADEVKGTKGVLDRFIGANAQILVDLATLGLQDRDVVALTSFSSSPELIAQAQKVMQSAAHLTDAAEQLSHRGAQLVFDSMAEGEDSILQNAHVTMIHVGQPTFTLREVAED